MMGQKPTWRGVLKYVAMYLVFFLLLNISLAWPLAEISNHSFWDCCLVAMLGRMDTVVDATWVDILSVIQGLLLTIAGAIMTGFVFQQVATKKPKIILPDKLIIRRRNFDNAIVLNVMVGNKDKEFIYNPKCTITCYYPHRKATKSAPTANAVPPMRGHYVREDATAVLQNYYRFGFVLSDFPPKFLDDYLNKPEGFNAAYIMVMISGSVNYCGQLQQFQIAKAYRLSDIVFGTQEDTKFMVEATNWRTGRKTEVVQWDMVMSYREISEILRQEIVRDLQAALKEKEKKTTKERMQAALSGLKSARSCGLYK